MEAESTTPMAVVWVIALIVAILIGLDARKHKVAITKKPYSINTGALAWGGSCLILPYLLAMVLGLLGFIVGILVMVVTYAIKRSKALEKPNTPE